MSPSHLRSGRTRSRSATRSRTHRAAAESTPPFATPFRPMHFYDEQRVLLHNTYQPGDVIRLTVPANSNAAWTVIDLVGFQDVARPAAQPENSVSVTEFGADPRGIRDSAGASALA